jgi:hypothetical protein
MEKMRISDLEGLDRDYITVKEAAEIIGCSPQRLRDGLDIDPDRYLFPHCKVGNRHHIMREGFIRWAKGDAPKSNRADDLAGPSTQLRGAI